MTDNRKIEDCWAIIVDGKAISARPSYNIAQMEAAVKKGVIRKAKLIWLDEPPKPPEPLSHPMENGSLDTLSQWT